MGRGDEWDEGDDGEVLDNWEEELEEPVVVKKPTVTPTIPKPKKQQAKQEDENDDVDLLETEAERKLRLEAAVKRADLDNACDLFGVDRKTVDLDDLSTATRTATTRAGGHFETADPQSIPEFEKFAEYVAEQLNSRLGQRKNYHAFLDSLIRKIVQPRELLEVRKISGVLSEMVTTKQKESRNVGGAAGTGTGTTTATTTTATTTAAKKKGPLLLATKKGRGYDLNDYGDDCFDIDD